MKGVQVQATGCSAADESNLTQVQRFTWTYKVIFSNTRNFTGEDVQITMTAAMTSNAGINVSGQAVIEPTTRPDAYEIDGPTSWLSIDLQVFNLLPNGSLPHTPTIALTPTRAAATTIRRCRARRTILSIWTSSPTQTQRQLSSSAQSAACRR